jgi:hypothetical protein
MTFDSQIEKEFNNNNNNDEEEIYFLKKIINGNINFIAELISVKLLSQKIGFYIINELMDKYQKLNNNNNINEIKYIYLESIISFLMKFGKIVHKRGKKEYIFDLEKFINEKLSKFQNNKNTPGKIYYKIYNLKEKQKNNWEDTLFEKANIPKGKEKNNNNNNNNESSSDSSDIENTSTNFVKNDNEIILILKNDLNSYINYLKSKQIPPNQISAQISNNFSWETIDNLILNEKISLLKIIENFFEVCIDYLDKKEYVNSAKFYIQTIIDYYSDDLYFEELNNFKNGIKNYFNIKIDDLVVDNKFMFEIVGNVFYVLIKDELYEINDFNDFAGKEKETIRNLFSCLKFMVNCNNNEKIKKSIFNDLKKTKVYEKEKKMFNEIVVLIDEKNK